MDPSQSSTMDSMKSPNKTSNQSAGQESTQQHSETTTDCTSTKDTESMKSPATSSSSGSSGQKKVGTNAGKDSTEKPSTRKTIFSRSDGFLKKNRKLSVKTPRVVEDPLREGDEKPRI